MAFEFVASSRLPTEFGDFVIHGFQDSATGKEHVALSVGTLNDGEPVLMRVHSECLTGDGFGSLRCDCGPQLQAAMQQISHVGRGVILYLRQEGRGIGLVNKIRAYALQDTGADTVEANERLGFGADLREYAMCEDMLRHLGVATVRLLTNNPKKVEGLRAVGIDVIERVPLFVGANPHNEGYMLTKTAKMGHLLKPSQS
ncbi:GTP cyclohydrolase II [Paraperlucidibaca baekdonensis]|uniref:GTP cyclohydrolase-2 n=1 Tax=Paraperlucidibaca baekdonensis TaxID=748120 RepID=A0A3E0H834_9GAMM|nr:GTP cyclohydrolase II [Paraperlucidibaca baekdonensis]REH39896.1 GTP cyclohydrolase II [Paraperlucidibaca baekdonensis]